MRFIPIEPLRVEAFEPSPEKYALFRLSIQDQKLMNEIQELNIYDLQIIYTDVAKTSLSASCA